MRTSHLPFLVHHLGAQNAQSLAGPEKQFHSLFPSAQFAKPNNPIFARITSLRKETTSAVTWRRRRYVLSRECWVVCFRVIQPCVVRNEELTWVLCAALSLGWRSLYPPHLFPQVSLGLVAVQGTVPVVVQEYVPAPFALPGSFLCPPLL
jgi:hypothetical protein